MGVPCLDKKPEGGPNRSSRSQVSIFHHNKSHYGVDAGWSTICRGTTGRDLHLYCRHHPKIWALLSVTETIMQVSRPKCSFQVETDCIQSFQSLVAVTTCGALFQTSLRLEKECRGSIMVLWESQECKHRAADLNSSSIFLYSEQTPHNPLWHSLG